MEHVPLPDQFEVKEIDQYQANIIIEPLFPGYGNTVGNALRRVLLSSLTGCAVTAFKIKGATHEFSTTPGIKEDLVEIILNLKTLRFKLHDVEEVRVTINAKGEKKVKAKDIKVTSDVEIITPEAEIATLTNKDSELEMELVVKSGRGYVPVENVEKKKLELGTIAIDAVFSPIKNVNFDIESVRVGQMTNFDRLIMSISTDGTISPEEAIKTAAAMMVDHFAQIATFGTKKIEDPVTEPAGDKIIEEKSSEASIQKTDEQPATDDKPKKKRGRPKKES